MQCNTIQYNTTAPQHKHPHQKQFNFFPPHTLTAVSAEQSLGVHHRVAAAVVSLAVDDDCVEDTFLAQVAEQARQHRGHLHGDEVDLQVVGGDALGHGLGHPSAWSECACEW